MKFGNRDYVPLTELVDTIDTKLRTLCEWLHDNNFEIFARSEIDDERFYKLKVGCYKSLLAYTEKEVEAIFFYPKEFEVFLKHATYHQRIKRKHLYLKSVDAMKVIKKIRKDIGPNTTIKYGVPLLRKPTHQTKPTWSRNHDEFISEANKLLKSNLLDYTKIVKSQRVPHIAKLSEELENARNRDKQKGVRNLGWKFRTIQEVLGKRQSELKVPKTK